MRITASLMVLALYAYQAHAQMPVPLMGAPTAKPEPALAAPSSVAAALIKEVLECRKKLNPHDPRLAGFLRESQPDTWEIAKEVGPLSVFNLPVVSVALYIDSSGELGASYSSTINATQADVNKAAAITKGNERTTKIGSLRTEHPQAATVLVCTVQP